MTSSDPMEVEGGAKEDQRQGQQEEAKDEVGAHDLRHELRQ